MYGLGLYRSFCFFLLNPFHVDFFVVLCKESVLDIQENIGL